jgi:hypothetical protein
MSEPTVLTVNDLYEIILTRQGTKMTYFFVQEGFLLTRTDDADTGEVLDDEGYSYFIFAREGFQSQHVSISVAPGEAESILDQIFELTGTYVCDF